MLYHNSIENILGLKDVIVEKVENIGTEKHIYLRMHKRLHACPDCGSITSKVHDYRTQIIRDVPCCGMDTILHLRKRRHVCRSCGKRFFETVDFLPKFSRFTNRVFIKITEDFKKCISIKDIAGMYNMSPPTAVKVLRYVAWTPNKLPEVLSIDEFKGNSGGEKFQCILTDAKNHRIFDILPSRKLVDLELYLRRFPNRNDVRFVIMDMTGNYKAVMQAVFPNATIVIDRYHYLRQLDFAVERIRKDAQKNLPANERIYVKHSRRLLMKDPEKLKTDEYYKLQRILDISPVLRKAYEIKQLFRTYRRCETRASAARALSSWIMVAQGSGIPELAAVAQTYSNWSKEILNSVECSYTNGYTEGCNNRIKVLKRVAFGMPRFDRFRARILHIMATEA